MSGLIEKISNKVLKPLTWILLVYMVFNMMVSAAVYRQTQRHLHMPAQTSVGEWMDRYFTDEVLHKIYPNMKQVK